MYYNIILCTVEIMSAAGSFFQFSAGVWLENMIPELTWKRKISSSMWRSSIFSGLRRSWFTGQYQYWYCTICHGIGDLHDILWIRFTGEAGRLNKSVWYQQRTPMHNGKIRERLRSAVWKWGRSTLEYFTVWENVTKLPIKIQFEVRCIISGVL